MPRWSADLHRVIVDLPPANASEKIFSADDDFTQHLVGAADGVDEAIMTQASKVLAGLDRIALD